MRVLKIRDETCPTEKGIATSLLESFTSLSRAFDETCPTEKGIATHAFVTLCQVFLKFLDETCPTEKGIATDIAEYFFASSQSPG